MKNLLSLLLLGLLGIQCASPPERLNNNSQLPQIIFVPGYYGSFLKRTKDNKRVWFSAGQAIWGNQTLALIKDGIQVPGAVELVEDGVFDSVDLIPGILSKDVYGKFIASLENQFPGQANIVTFAYDWRQDITLSVQQLAQLVEKLYAEGAPKVAIVSHSMGGLITSFYLLYGDQTLKDAQPNMEGAIKLHAVVMAGTPFKGTMSIFYDMQFGVQFGLNQKALESDAVASFPSSYQLLPQYPQSLHSLNGDNLTYWIFDEAKWQNKGWSLFRNVNEIKPATLFKRREYTKKMLSLGKETYKKLHDYQSNLNSAIPFVYFFSDEIPTINQALWFAKENTLLFPDRNITDLLKEFDEDLLLSRGDGTVTKQSAQPPPKFATTFPNLEVNNVGGEHLELLKQQRTIVDMVQFLQKALRLSPN